MKSFQLQSFNGVGLPQTRLPSVGQVWIPPQREFVRYNRQSPIPLCSLPFPPCPMPSGLWLPTSDLSPMLSALCPFPLRPIFNEKSRTGKHPWTAFLSPEPIRLTGSQINKSFLCVLRALCGELQSAIENSQSLHALCPCLVYTNGVDYMEPH